MSESFLLDTDVWVWFLNGDESRFTKSALKTLTTAASKDLLLVSDVSVWEVAQRSARGSLTLWPTLDDWLGRARSVPGITYVALDRETLVLSTRMPGVFSGNSTDRIVMAAAALNSVGLATANTAMLEYGKKFGRIAMLDVAK